MVVNSILLNDVSPSLHTILKIISVRRYNFVSVIVKMINFDITCNAWCIQFDEKSINSFRLQCNRFTCREHNTFYQNAIKFTLSVYAPKTMKLHTATVPKTRQTVLIIRTDWNFDAVVPLYYWKFSMNGSIDCNIEQSRWQNVTSFPRISVFKSAYNLIRFKFDDLIIWYHNKFDTYQSAPVSKQSPSGFQQLLIL